jgi:pimeloyl-ACP methyl ester carboxylesterase
VIKVLLPGIPTAGSDGGAEGSRAFFEGIAKVKVKHARELQGTSRAGSAPAEVMVEAAPDDVVELEFKDEFEGGVRQWVSVAQLQEDMERSGHRSTQLGGVVVPLQPIGAPAGGEARGAAEWVLKGLKIFGFDPVEKTADFAERKIVENFEEKLNKKSGLCPLDGPTALGTPLTAESQFDVSGPALVFVHGTASSIGGSFAQLAGSWEKLTARYARRIYGLQHKTLSVSPVANALALAELIPDGATLHLVSHSRGGLVGELLCIRQITTEQIDAFQAKAAQRDEEAEPAERDARKKARAEELAALKKLSALLEKRRYKIERFVRVACPARGTILASGRLDLYLSLITSAIDYAVQSAPYLQPIHEFLEAVTMEIARRRTRPEGLPGFEAQMPESPLIHLLNNTGLESQADLAVIAGDIDMGSGFWKSLGVLATNLFYLEKHDLVVNTEAMYAGMARAGGTWAFFDQGSDVSHFNYFKNPATRDRLLSWLEQPAGQNIDAEFKRRTREAIAATSRSGGVRDTAGLPVLFIVPGMMGTLLKDAGGPLWLDQARLSAHGVVPLEIGAAGVQTAGIVKLGYQQFEQRFSSTYNVVLFEYDWRRSVADAAELLAAQVKARDDKGEIVRIVAHSMGGLVARAMIALYPKLWESVCAKGGRLIQLGTPNKGTFAVPRILWGVEPTVQMLAMLDPGQTKKKVCEIFAAYPGLADMLPETEDDRFFDEAWWAKEQGQFARPLPDELRRAQALRGTISAGDKRGIFYVAGAGDATPTDLSFDADGPVWMTTDEGDGTVPYALGRIAGIEPYYVAAVHGELANEPAAFDGYAELLATGGTTKLSKTPPPRERAAGARNVLRGPEPVLFPTEEELLAAALGKKRGRRPQRRALPPLNIAVRHGDLRRSRLPLVIGHYLGDKIVHAERTLDDQFEGQLSRRAALGLYPGEEGTVELILAPGCQPPGALVVGLGQVGEISMEKVRRAMMEAALRYAVHLAEKPAEREKTGASPSAGLSALLIGTGGGIRPLRIADSVSAIVAGILDANRALEAEKLIDRVCFDTLHLVELFETVAAQALYAARARPAFAARARRWAGDRGRALRPAAGSRPRPAAAQSLRNGLVAADRNHAAHRPGWKADG